MGIATLGDRLRTAVFGIATRRALADYLLHLALVLFILLLVGWTIDLAGTFRGIRTEAAEAGVPTHEILLPYLLFRSADIIARTLPMSCFFGVFLAEVRRRSRLETVILGVGGATPWRMLTAILLFGAILGAVQYKLEKTWRPAAVAEQVSLGHGGYAKRFAQRWTGGYHWFLSGETALRAKVLRSDEPALRDILIFRGLRAESLQSVISAEHATPTGTPGQWQLQGADFWDIAGGGEGYVAMGDMRLALDLIPEQLRHLNVPGFYLPDPALHAIAAMRNDPVRAADADTAIWRRRTAWLLPGVVAFLAVSLAKSGYSGRRADIPWLIGLGLAGYIAVVSVKVLWSVGELGGLPAPVAVGASLGYMLAIGLWLTWRQITGKRRT